MDLTRMFNPRRMALIGATERSHFSRVVTRNLVEAGEQDRVALVNRKGGEVHGLPAYRSCVDVGEPIDLAVIMVGQGAVLESLTDAAAAGARYAVLFTAGYAELGTPGRAEQERLVQHCRDLDIVLLGPNLVGFSNFVAGVPACGITVPPSAPGDVALISQSGACASAMHAFASMNRVELSYLVTVGNEAMVTAGDVLEHMVNDPSTRSIAMFLETIREPARFASAARRAAEVGKPVVVLKTGSSEVSARTAAAHTGALVGDDRAVSAMFDELGVIRVDSIEDLLLTASVAGRVGRLEGPGVAAVSISGGAAGILADRIADTDLEFADLEQQTLDAVGAVLPDYGTVGNPIDVTGAALNRREIFSECVRAVSADPGVGLTLVVNSLPWLRDGREWALKPTLESIGDGIRQASGPVIYVSQVEQQLDGPAAELLTEIGDPVTVTGLTKAAQIAGRIAWWSAVTRRAVGEPVPVQPPPMKAERSGTWSEAVVRDFLDAAGLPVVPARTVASRDEAAKTAVEMDAPVAMKIVSDRIAHKSEVGGVRLGVTGADEAAIAFDALVEAGNQAGVAIDGVLVSPMRTGGLELLVGVVRNPDWGLMLTVGFGGVLTELLDDVQITSAPATADRVRELLTGLRGARLFAGYRGQPATDLDALAQVIARFSGLAAALGDDLESIEINPLWVNAGQVEALDGLLEWRSPDGR